ncbi:MAG: glutamine amidotransferase subunit PdxT [Candidatus Altiarchaeales archaeon WOR_SM1_86-2]|nr:MAG: glutamine amidotransferase subunit PdxT [Candidatus Altiarchaeales archaeon WOR_SM1_86-2]
MKIGVLSLQGDVSEHVSMMRKVVGKAGADGEVVDVKNKNDLNVDALIIPGGESTTIGKLLLKNGMVEEVRRLAGEDIPVMGTCAGLILLAKEVDKDQKTSQYLLGLMNMEVKRNAFGRQKESFEIDLRLDGLKFEKPFPCVFIRAPIIERVWGDCKVLGKCDGKIIAAQQGNLMALSFHPELTHDTRIHEYFLSLVLSK